MIFSGNNDQILKSFKEMKMLNILARSPGRQGRGTDIYGQEETARSESNKVASTRDHIKKL